MTKKNVPLTFRPKARILQMLGEQLIGSSRLAIFELVKNAYDADATKVTISFKNINTPNMSIQIEDNGIGMTYETIRDIWLVPAHDHQAKKREKNKRTKRGRLPLGEKGLGRFAVHKLGNKIELITKNANSTEEVVVSIDWEEQIKKEFLSDTEIYVIKKAPDNFEKQEHGTIIKITQLKETNWSRGEIRRLYRQIQSINSPFTKDPNNDFRTFVDFENHNDLIKDIPTPEEMKLFAPWHCTFNLDINGLLNLNYEFKGVKGISVQQRDIVMSSLPLLLNPKHLDKNSKDNIPLTKELLEGIGPVHGTIYIYDRDPKILRRFGNQNMIKEYLDENGGIRIYRDNIRVYNYGEKNDDWLGLDLRRVNIPGVRVSRNIILGSIELNHELSNALIEKTNREGFDENQKYIIFRAIILSIITQIEAERKKDKDRLRLALLPAKDREAEKVEKPIQLILKKLNNNPTLKLEIEPLLKSVEKNFQETQSIMINQGLTNMGIGIIFHEVEHGVKDLAAFAKVSDDISEIKQRVEDLNRVLETFSELIKNKDNETISLKDLFKTIRNILRMRFSLHQIQLICPFLEEDKEDIKIKASKKILIGIINNLLDNSIYWLQVKWPVITDNSAITRKIYLNAYIETKFLTITIGDNGTGFSDAPEDIIKPFFTRKNEGMGIGLHYVDIAMSMMGGNLEFDTEHDTAPSDINGAVVNLIFDQKIIIKD